MIPLTRKRGVGQSALLLLSLYPAYCVTNTRPSLSGAAYVRYRDALCVILRFAIMIFLCVKVRRGEAQERKERRELSSEDLP